MICNKQDWVISFLYALTSEDPYLQKCVLVH